MANEIPEKVAEQTARPTCDEVLQRLTATIAARRGADPATSYVATLFAKGDEAMIKKIGEEATEAVMAAKDGDRLRLTAEIADLWFHTFVLLAQQGMTPEDVWKVLELRRR